MIRLIGIGVRATSPLLAELAAHLPLPASVDEESLDPQFAWSEKRSQYYSTLLLQSLALRAGDGDRILGVTHVDLFVPVLTFVFGEAQLSGPAAVVSTYRLREETYGLPPDPIRLKERLLKEAMHELGHTFGLRHCHDWQCVMASSHGIEMVDVKGSEFCAGCKAKISTARH